MCAGPRGRVDEGEEGKRKILNGEKAAEDRDERQRERKRMKEREKERVTRIERFDREMKRRKAGEGGGVSKRSASVQVSESCISHN